jgi:hypothetical protein
MDRPALQQLVAAIRSRRIDIVVVYKVDRLTRSLTDFAKLVELFDHHDVSFVSVTQSFNTTTSMGGVMLSKNRVRKVQESVCKRQKAHKIVDHPPKRQGNQRKAERGTSASCGFSADC